MTDNTPGTGRPSDIDTRDPWYIKVVPYAVVSIAAGSAVWLYFEYVDAFGSLLPPDLSEEQIKTAASDSAASARRGEFGALGDVFGGLLNPLFTFVTMILLLLTIRQTQKTNQIALRTLEKTEYQIQQTGEALKQSKDSMDQAAKMLAATERQVEASVKEMEYTRVELEGSKKAQQEISVTQINQRNDAYFSMLLDQHQRFVDGMMNRPDIGRQEDQPLQKLCRQVISSAASGSIHEVSNNAHLRESKVWPYLGFLVGLLDSIVNVENSERYLHMLRLIIPPQILQITFFLGSELGAFPFGSLYVSQVKKHRLLEGTLSPSLKEIGHGRGVFAKSVSESIIFFGSKSFGKEQGEVDRLRSEICRIHGF